MILHTRLVKAVSTMRRLGQADCTGMGTITALLDADSPLPPPCRVCGGWHVRVIEEVVVEPAEPDPGDK